MDNRAIQGAMQVIKDELVDINVAFDGALAMKAKRIYEDDIDEWLLDTGSTYNLVNKSSLDDIIARTKIAARNADIETVSGRVRLSEEVHVEIPNFTTYYDNEKYANKDERVVHWNNVH